MLKAKQSISRETTRPGAKTIAQVLRQQFDRIPDSLFHSHSAMFLTDVFALGYYFGFAKDTSGTHGMQRDGVDLDFVKDVLSQVLGNPSAVDPFIAYAHCLRNDILFQKGYEAGLMDFNAWNESDGNLLPLCLALHFKGF